MKRNATILVVEDEADLLRGICEALTAEGFEVEGVSTGTEGLRVLAQRTLDVVVTDLKLPGAGGMEILRKAQENDAETATIVITGYGTIESAVEAMRMGAFDYITKPFDLQKLKIAVRNALGQSALAGENRYLRKSTEAEWRVDEIVAASPGSREVLEAAARVAGTDTTVLLAGESGTGKELLARFVHRRSARADGLFVAINCGLLGETFLASELFGHVKGAFTGAVETKRGLLEIAHRGTLFLDEIGDVSLPVQAKLLRVLEERSFMRLGGTETIHVDIRLVAATNRDLEKSIREGTFREDLYYRLNVFAIVIPPLRGRKEDIPPLVDHLVTKHARKLGKKIEGVTREAMDAMLAYEWPGNVRELANAIERAVILARDDRVSVDDLPTRIQGQPGSPADVTAAGPYAEAKRRLLEEFTRRYVLRMLEKHGNNVTRAAEEAGMDRANFQRLVRSARTAT